MDLRDRILNGPMTTYQNFVVSIGLIIAMIDGYEVVSMPFTMPHLAKAWALTPVEVGYLLSASIFGMALGAILVSPLADRIGRLRQIQLCLSMITIGMALSSAAQDVTQLVAFRAFAGLFIGAIISSLNIVIAEYCSDRRRGTVMGLYGVGLPLGSALAGPVIVILIGAYGWRAPFVFGAALSAIMLALVFIGMPESISYLTEKRPAGALRTYNRIAQRLGLEKQVRLPEPQLKIHSKNFVTHVFSGITMIRTICLWVGYAGLVSAFYFANTWTAKLIADASGNSNLGIRAGMMIQVGGVIGALVFAALSMKLRPRLVTALILALGAGAFALYASHISNVTVALFLATLVGMAANGGVAAYYAISPMVYPTVARGTGVGLMIGFGRAVAILAPILTGYLLAAGWTAGIIYQLFGAVLLFSSITALILDRTYLGRSENPESPEAVLRGMASAS